MSAGSRVYNEREYRRRAMEVRRVGDLLCWICGQPGADTLDHVVPVARGGGNDLENLRPAHGRCNSYRGAGLAPPRRPIRSRRW